MRVAHLRDPRVGALAVDAVVLQPLVLWVRAVLLEGAAVLSFTPNAPKQRICLQAQAAAPALGVTLVQVDCERGNETGVKVSTVKRKSGIVQFQVWASNEGFIVTTCGRAKDLGLAS